jgi:hypothetical protein
MSRKPIRVYNIPNGTYVIMSMVTAGGYTKVFGKVVESEMSDIGQQHIFLTDVIVNNESLNFRVNREVAINTLDLRENVDGGSKIQSIEIIPSGAALYIKLLIDKIPETANDADAIEQLVSKLSGDNILPPNPIDYGIENPTEVYSNIDGEEWDEDDSEAEDEDDVGYGGKRMSKKKSKSIKKKSKKKSKTIKKRTKQRK